jgi:hypothetical protein
MNISLVQRLTGYPDMARLLLDNFSRILAYFLPVLFTYNHMDDLLFPFVGLE